MTKDRRTFIKAIGGAGLTAGLAGCMGGSGDGNGNGNGSGSGDGSVQIGALFPLSGDLAELGQESFRGVELAVMERNENDGLGGSTIEIAQQDAPDPDAGVSAVENLATVEEVPAVVGSYSSSISKASSQRAASYDLPYWELGAVADSITEEGPPNTFRTCAPASFFGRDGMDLAANVIAPALDVSTEELRVAIMYESGEYGNAVGASAANAAEELGINVVEEIEYEADTSDLSSSVQRLGNADIHVLNHTGYDADIQLLWNQLANLDVFIPAVIGNGGGYSLQTFRENVGNTATLGVFNEDFTQYNTNPEFAPGIEEFVELYQSEYDSPPVSGHSLANYFGMNVVLDIMEEASSFNLNDVRDAAFNMDVEENTTATSWGVKFNQDTQQNERISVVGHQWQEDTYDNDIWRPDVTDGTPGLYSVFPEEARLEEIDVTNIPQPDYTEN